MPTTKILGKVSIVPKGQWVADTAYDKLDIVTDNGTSYLAIKAVPKNIAPSNSSYWEILASRGPGPDTNEIQQTVASWFDTHATPTEFTPVLFNDPNNDGNVIIT